MNIGESFKKKEGERKKGSACCDHALFELLTSSGGRAPARDCAGACRWAYNCRLLKKLRNAGLLVHTTFVWPRRCWNIYIITVRVCCKKWKSFYANACKTNRQVIIIILFEIKKHMFKWWWVLKGDAVDMLSAQLESDRLKKIQENFVS